MTDHLDPVFLAKWLAGRLDAEERRAVDEWLDVASARRAELEELRELWDRAGAVAEDQAAAASSAAAEIARWNAIQRAIHEQGVAAGRPHSPRLLGFPLSRGPSRIRRRLVAAAAAVALVVGGGTVWRVMRYEIPTAQEFVVGAGVPRTMTLSDGSMVTLAAGSRLTFTDGRWPWSSRHASLRGQAFFAVAHDAQRPFIVTAGDVTTRVLGTEFSVRAYPGDTLRSVVVRSGKVGVAASGSKAASDVVVTPNHEARVDDLGRIRISVVDLDRTLAWTAGRLEFAGTEVATVLREVNRWYGLQLRLADTSLSHHRVTVTFDGATADDVIATLTRLLGSSALLPSHFPGPQR